MKHFFFAIALLAGTQIGQAQTTVAAWTFENNAIANNNSPTVSTLDPYGTASADAIGMNVYATPAVGTNKDDVLQGVTSGTATDTGANGVSDGTKIWRVRGGSGGNGWSSAAPIGTQGAQFFAPTTGLTSLNTSRLTVSFDWYATTQGEANLMLAYTDDGTNWIDTPVTLSGSDAGAVVLTNTTSTNTVLGSYVSDNLANNGSSAGQDWFTGLSATIVDPLALNNAKFGIEMVNASTGADDVSTQGTALNNSSGNWRFDNVSIVATPEPSTWILLIGSFCLLAACIKFGRNSRAA